MVRVALDAGHGINTPGKRTPADEREWSFNNKVVLAAIKYLKDYQNVEVLRLDDPTGKTDVPLTTRTNRANSWKADILISVHHNANTGKWGTWTGTETYTYIGNWKDAERLATIVQARLVKAYGLRNRGVKKANLHMLRESSMPAILTEGCFMDSTVDIPKLRDDRVLDAAGKAIAEGVAEYFKLKKKTTVVDGPTPIKPEAKPAGTFLIKVLATSLWYYDRPDWNARKATVKKGEVFTVVETLTVAGAKMYKLKSGTYITANPQYVQKI